MEVAWALHERRMGNASPATTLMPIARTCSFGFYFGSFASGASSPLLPCTHPLRAKTKAQRMFPAAPAHGGGAGVIPLLPLSLPLLQAKAKAQRRSRQHQLMTGAGLTDNLDKLVRLMARLKLPDMAEFFRC